MESPSEINNFSESANSRRSNLLFDANVMTEARIYKYTHMLIMLYHSLFPSELPFRMYKI